MENQNAPLRILLSGSPTSTNYVEALSALGARATLAHLPAPDTGYDGLVLCGGVDVDPALYGEEINGAKNIDRARDACELALIAAFIAAGKPIFGICRGQQILNVYFGGTLHQHLPETETHRQGVVENIASHPATAGEAGLIHRLYGTRFTVNSIHHQAIKALGRGLIPTAHSADGYIEAIEHQDLPVFAVQWHPEQLCGQSQPAVSARGEALFSHFLDLCRAGKK